MKLTKQILSMIAVIILTMTVIAVPVLAEEEYAQVDNNYDTLRYHTDVTLSENNVYHIEETIVVNFTNPRHGIYRYIPYKGVMSYEENGVVKENKFRSDIKNVSVAGERFDKEYENGNLVLRIGDEDRYLSGKKSYSISFDYDAGDDKIGSFDRIYINMIPYGWRTAIQEASFTLTLPKEVAPDSVNFFSGEYGSAIQGNFDYTVDGNVISGKSKEPLSAFEGATVYSKVDEGYFTGERNDTAMTILMWVLILAIPLLAILLYLLFGRDEPIIPIVTVTPPSNMPPSEVGYIMDSSVDNKDMFSLIIYWADKGYLSITDDNTADFLLTKLTELPQGANAYERTMFDGLFVSGDCVSTAELKTKFYPKLELSKTQLRAKFSKRLKTSLYTTSSTVSQGIVALLAVVPMVAGTMFSGYIAIADIIYTMGSLFACFIVLCSLIGAIVTASKWYVLKKSTRIGSVIGCSVCFFVACLIAVVLGLSQLPMILPIIIGAIASAIATLLACVLPKRTSQCTGWFSELIGLKEFIEVAEKDRIEQLVYEDPSYFYDILPYAYVLGVSDAWAKKFADISIEPPAWYSGNYYQPNMFSTYIFMRSFNSCMSNMNQTLSIPPAQVNSGNGSGGGFSGGSFGGGGFSGGGGGSW